MKDNNPFKPVLPRPVSDNDLANDPNADNFLASSNGINDRLSQHVTLDGMLSANPQSQNDFGDIASLTNSRATTALGGNPKPSTQPAANHKPVVASEPKATDSKSDIFAAAAAAADGQSVASKATDGKFKLEKKGRAKKDTTKKAAQNSGEKQITISLLTIVFGVLFIISTIAAIYFYTQNNKSQSELADAKAKVSQLSDTANNDSAESSKATTNYDALQNRIQDLSKQVTDKDKDISTKQKTIDDQNSKITSLNKQITDLQNKVNSDKSVSENMKSLVTTLCTNDQFKSSSACVSNGQSQTQTQANHATAPANTTNTQSTQH